MFAMRRHNSSIAPAVSRPPIKRTPRFCGPSATMRSDSASSAPSAARRAIASALSSHTPLSATPANIRNSAAADT